jgi:hypothetical protein
MVRGVVKRHPSCLVMSTHRMQHRASNLTYSILPKKAQGLNYVGRKER